MRCKEEETYESMPEGLQNVPSGKKMQRVISEMQTVIESLEKAQQPLGEAAA